MREQQFNSLQKAGDDTPEGPFVEIKYLILYFLLGPPLLLALLLVTYVILLLVGVLGK
jgi:hypothetical protein